MPEDEKLTTADADDLASALSFALRFNGRKRTDQAEAVLFRRGAGVLPRFGLAGEIVAPAATYRWPVQRPASGVVTASSPPR